MVPALLVELGSLHAAVDGANPDSDTRRTVSGAWLPSLEGCFVDDLLVRVSFAWGLLVSGPQNECQRRFISRTRGIDGYSTLAEHRCERFVLLRSRSNRT